MGKIQLQVGVKVLLTDCLLWWDNRRLEACAGMCETKRGSRVEAQLRIPRACVRQTDIASARQTLPRLRAADGIMRSKVRLLEGHQQQFFEACFMHSREECAHSSYIAESPGVWKDGTM